MELQPNYYSASVKWSWIYVFIYLLNFLRRVLKAFLEKHTSYTP